MKATTIKATAPRFWAMLVEVKAPMNPALKTMSEAKPTTLPRLQQHFKEKRHA